MLDSPDPIAPTECAIANVYFKAAEQLGLGVRILSEKHGAGEIYSGSRELLVYGRWIGINDLTSTMLCANKHYSARCLAGAGLPVPESIFVPSSYQRTRESAARALVDAAHDRYPICIKPVVGSHGLQVVPDIRSENELLRVLYTDPLLGRWDMLIESHCQGRHYRAIVAFDELIGCVERRPPVVTGDGRRTLEALIDEYNEGRRAENLDEVSFGPRQSYTVERRCNLGRASVVPDGLEVVLDDRCNLKVGGTFHFIDIADVSDRARDLCTGAAKVFDLKFAGLDLIGDDLRGGDGWVINEVNSQPAAHVPAATMTRKQRLTWPIRLLRAYFSERPQTAATEALECSLPMDSCTEGVQIQAEDMSGK